MTTEHKKLEKKVAALEARIRRLETVTHPQDFNFTEDYVRQSSLKKRFKKAQEEETVRAILGESV